ncbi:hypothetical protein ScPMuIL_017717 [Solemya velum]
MCKLFLFSLAKFTSEKNSSARRKRTDSEQMKGHDLSPEHLMLIQDRGSCRCHEQPFLRNRTTKSDRTQQRAARRCHGRSNTVDKMGKRPMISEEHWSKVLQANEPSTSCRCGFCNCRKPYQRRHWKNNGKGVKNDQFWQNTSVVSLFNRFCNWVSSKRKYHVVAFGSVNHRHFAATDIQSHDSLLSELPSEREDIFDGRDTLTKTVTPEINVSTTKNSKPNLVLHQRPSTTVPTVCIGDCDRIVPETDRNLNVCDKIETIPLASDITNNEKFELLTVGFQRQPLTSSVSCPPKTQDNSSDTRPRLSTLPTLCATWPTVGRRRGLEDEDIEDDLPFDDFEDIRVPKQDDENGLGDFAIPFSALEICECVRVGRSCSIHRGRWHGDVAIHCFRNPEDNDAKSFWSSVSKLCRIRHENVALFMGACVEAQHLAVVTSMQSGVSLYEHVHCKQEKSSLHWKVQILRQIAQGMGYLHAKGIVMRKLNTRNVFMCPKVKLSVMDYGTAERRFDVNTCGCIPRGHLTYVAPEILRTMRVVPPRLIATAEYTQESDIYSFGTIIYEMIASQYPMSGVSPQIVIWQICSGHRQSLDHLKTTRLLKV